MTTNADYRFLVTNVLSNEVEAELPVEDASYGDQLNSPGAMNATVRISDPLGVEIPPNPATGGFAGDAYVELDGDGDYLSVPDEAAFDITGDLCVVAKVALDDWTPATLSTVVSKWLATGNQRSWQLSVSAAGALTFQASSGSSDTVSEASALLGYTDGTSHWVAVTLDVDDGGGNHAVSFWEGGTGVAPVWTLNQTDTTAGANPAILASTADLTISGINDGADQPFDGSVEYVAVYDGIGDNSAPALGTEVFELTRGNIHDAYEAQGRDITSITAETGQTVTAHGDTTAFASTQAQPPAADIRPGEQALYVERNGVIVWGGIIWTYDINVEQNVGYVGAEGFFSALRRRIITADYDVTGRDQALIVKDLIDAAQLDTGGDLNLDTSTLTAVGKTRDRSYLLAERKPVGEAIEQLAAVRDGFDFYITSRWGTTEIERAVYVQYPATGRQTAYVLELGRNLELLDMTIDATTLTHYVYATGADGLTSVQSQATSPYVRVDVDVNESDVSVQSTLDDHALRALDRGTRPMRLLDVSIYPTQEPVLGSFLVGDIVEVRGTFGAVDFSGDYRITTWEASIDQTNNESVTLSLAPVEVFA